MPRPFKPKICAYTLTSKHRTPDGKRVTKDTPGAVRCDSPARCWYGKYRDAGGVNRRVNLGPNKAAAEKILAKLVTDSALGKYGLADALGGHSKTPIAEHLAAFEAHLRSTTNRRGRKNTDQHVATTIRRARRVVTGCAFKLLADISPGQIERFLAELPRAGAQTRNFYLQAIGQFARWLVTVGRVAGNAVAGLQKENVELDPRHPRRAFQEEELPRIFAAAAASPRIFRGLAGDDRVALYATALGTGFRVRELASLTPGCFDLDQATVNVLPQFTKDRKPVKGRPIPRALVDHLRVYLEGASPGRAIWPGKWTCRAARMVALDLEEARATWLAEARDLGERGQGRGAGFLVYRNAEGLYADFHSWRHTFVSQLDAAGVSGKVTMDLARHKDPRLTLGRYAHAEQRAAVDAINSLPLAIPKPVGRDLIDKAIQQGEQ